VVREDGRPTILHRRLMICSKCPRKGWLAVNGYAGVLVRWRGAAFVQSVMWHLKNVCGDEIKHDTMPEPVKLMVGRLSDELLANTGARTLCAVRAAASTSALAIGVNERKKLRRVFDGVRPPLCANPRRIFLLFSSP
jgi:hypothetical protein